MKKITKIEVGITIVLALTIVAFSTFYNTAPRSNNVRSAMSGTHLASSSASSLSSESIKPVERVQVMDADILGN